MTEPVDPSLQRAIEALSSPGILVGHRLIAPGDELALLAAEEVSMASPRVDMRRASGAARVVGRALMARLGHAACAVPRSPSGEPLWPAGVTGSFAHDERIAVAAVANSRDVAAVGIDVEPAEWLPPGMLDMVATTRERQTLGDDPYRERLLFAAKEAVYKTVYPLDRIFLEFHDIEVDLTARKAVTRNGREIELRYCMAAHMVVLALIRAPISGPR
ncbi:MAG: 4'-phosphopantetheinyl transferase superfamily protein [Rhizobiales bacterium]|nr:4'-phosphopantetheinyl transferase superfamily protein [Hyphomicrobiales bacterium]